MLPYFETDIEMGKDKWILWQLIRIELLQRFFIEKDFKIARKWGGYVSSMSSLTESK